MGPDFREHGSVDFAEAFMLYQASKRSEDKIILDGDTFKDIVGNPYYVAPEVVKKRYGPEADVWSAGVILYILLSGVPPFSAETNKGIFRKILVETPDLESQQWADISDEAKDLIRKMLEKDPELRISVNDILCDPWLVDESKAPEKPLDPVILFRLQQFSAISKAQEDLDAY